MATNQRSILLQRAIRAENARRIAEEDAARSKMSLAEAHAAIRRLQVGAVLGAKLNPIACVPPLHTEAQIVTIRRAVARADGWRCPSTGEVVAHSSNAYWLPVENENELGS